MPSVMTFVLNRTAPPTSLEAEAETVLVTDDGSLPPAPVRVLLAHRHAIVREGTRHILESDSGFEVVGETVSLTTAEPLVGALKPDVLVLGLDPAEVESRTYVRQLRGVLGATRVLVLDYGTPPQRLARLGVTAWIAGTAAPVELVAGIRAAAEGRQVAGSPTMRLASDDPQLGHPTPRELEVLTLIEQGMTTRAIAQQLQTTPRTVHFHVGNLFAKLGARSRTEMVHLARRRGWLA
jgi:DNA-binding NarL/FixJ family response regulator